MALPNLAKDIEENLIPINSVLNLSVLNLTERQAKDLFSGKEITYDLQDGEYLTMLKGFEFSIVECKDKKIKNKIYLYKEEKV